MNNIKRIAVKELYGFFTSFTAFIFLFAFLLTILFVFFWLDPFFARNSADLRPIFEAMPTLLLYLCSALTMRMWSEERRSGTLEYLLTLPVSNLEFVLGKFIACLLLVAAALLLTLPLPITIALFAGPLDWGPVIGGYLASLFLAGVYIAIGMDMSARTDNQIVSLLLSMLTCGLFLLVGSPTLIHLANLETGEILALLGTGSRFQAITRGVVDFRDLYYYFSLTCIFLVLNILNLERIRWANNRSNKSHQVWNLITALCVANFIVGNLWLKNLTGARLDLTEGRVYTLSQATFKTLDSLKEPLLIRGYFSKRMQPLLQVLIPKLKDILNEYQATAPDKIKVEFLDPQSDPKVEKEVLQNYGIRPLPFKSADKYQASIVNSYFDVVLKYGDQYQKLNWQDLIEVSTHGKELEAELRNPEYDITSAVKKLLSGYQSAGNIFSNLDKPVTFTGYISSNDKLPPPLIHLKSELNDLLETLENQSNGKFTYEIKDPGAPNSASALELEGKYGYRPMSLTSSGGAPFFFYMSLNNGNSTVQIPLENLASSDSLKRGLDLGLRKFVGGVSKTIGIYQGTKERSPYSGAPIDPCQLLTKHLEDEYLVQSVTLEDGYVPDNIDLMVLLSPEYLNENQIFALDQFLMRGGTLVISTSPFSVNLNSGLSCQKAPGTVLAWLKSYGIEIQKTMVLDSENFPLVTPTKRMVDKTEVVERAMAPYPYSVAVSKNGLDKVSGIMAGIKQVFFSWCSPISVNRVLNQNRKLYELLTSSANAWTSDDLNITPQYSADCPLGFKEGKDKGRKLLAIAVEGRFDSYFKSGQKPILFQKTRDNNTKTPQNVIEKSPDNSKILVFASNTFLTDKVIYLMSAVFGRLSLEPIDIVQNSIDWSLNDRELLNIRGHGNFVRALYPPTPGSQMLFELMNYGLSVLSIFLLFVLSRVLMVIRNKSLDKLLLPLSKAATRE